MTKAVREFDLLPEQFPKIKLINDSNTLHLPVQPLCVSTHKQ